MKSFKSTASGALLAIGREADLLYGLQNDILTFMKKVKYVPVWLPSLTEHSYFHPQAIDSEHKSGHLVHAACLPFFGEVPKFDDEVYFGFNRVHRLEPLRTFNASVRLEAFEVAEIIITGSMEFTADKYQEIKSALTAFLSSYNSNGQWVKAQDAFLKKFNKEEWVIYPKSREAVAVASGNWHGSYFSRARGLDGYSSCFGIGIERLAEYLEA